jgi:hypothetical protein
MANVERMLQSEKQSIKALPKVSAAAEFDLNEGIVSVKAATKGLPSVKQEEKKSAAVS